MSQASAVEALLFAALEKPTAAERIVFLDSACAGDTELRRQVEKLLKAHADAGDFLNKPVGELLAAAPEPSDAAQALDGSTDRGGGNLAQTEGDGVSDDPDGALDYLQPPARPDALGRIKHYEVLEVLGKGGFGIVFRAIDETLQRVVAIKMLRAQIAATSSARKRFLREARSSAMVRHENVVQLYAVEEQPVPYLVMEFIPGETL
jgi:eukaryotic-like serine/threonine-protein kinase